MTVFYDIQLTPGQSIETNSMLSNGFLVGLNMNRIILDNDNSFIYDLTNKEDFTSFCNDFNREYVIFDHVELEGAFASAVIHSPVGPLDVELKYEENRLFFTLSPTIRTSCALYKCVENVCIWKEEELLSNIELSIFEITIQIENKTTFQNVDLIMYHQDPPIMIDGGELVLENGTTLHYVVENEEDIDSMDGQKVVVVTTKNDGVIEGDLEHINIILPGSECRSVLASLEEI